MNRDDFNSTVYWGLFGGGFFTALHYGGKAQSQFYRAINTYNGVEDELSYNKINTSIAPRLSYSWSF